MIQLDKLFIALVNANKNVFCEFIPDLTWCRNSFLNSAILNIERDIIIVDTEIIKKLQKSKINV